MARKVGGAGGVLEDNALVIALAIALGFGAIDAHWPFFATLDATFSTRCCAISAALTAQRVMVGRLTQTTRLCSFPGNLLGRSRRIQRNRDRFLGPGRASVLRLRSLSLHRQVSLSRAQIG